VIIYLVVDHLSIVVSGISEGDERRTLDNLMTHLRSLTEQLNIALILISHLKRPDGNKSHEENLKPTISQLRGSQSIAQLSDIILGLSRNSATGDNTCEINVLKNRFSGTTGLASILSYNPETGRLFEDAFDD
jgi:twinkle protein